MSDPVPPPSGTTPPDPTFAPSPPVFAPYPGPPAPPAARPPYGASESAALQFGAPHTPAAAPPPGYPQFAQPQGQPGYQPQGPPGFPSPGQSGYPPVGYPGFSPPPGFGPPPAPAKKRGTLKIVLFVVGIVVILLVGLGIFGVNLVLSATADPARQAEVGDCLSATGTVADVGTTETSADVVACTSAEAEFTVVARIEGESSPDSKSCDKFFAEDEEFYVYGSTANGGYVLCLRPQA